MDSDHLSVASDALVLVPLLGSVLAGAAMFLLIRWVLVSVISADEEQDDDWRYDVSRINELRRLDLTYRYFQPIIQILARFNRRVFRGALPEIQRELQAAGFPRYWLAEEYLGRAELVAILLLPVYVYLGFVWMQGLGAFGAVLLSIATAWLLRRRLAAQARNRLQAIKRRMPFLLDLLTLLMEAGSTFLHSLRQGVEEFAGHPVGFEFGRVLTDINLGKPRTDAFAAMRDRLKDDEITGIIGAIIQGEQLGTPLARIFRTQSDVLRVKRSQRAETIAAEAGVKMLLPGVLVMMSTVLIILGPFVLNYLYSGFGL